MIFLLLADVKKFLEAFQVVRLLVSVKSSFGDRLEKFLIVFLLELFDFFFIQF